RFLSVDPLMVVDDPRQHNAYQYGNNSPLTEWDPTGEALPECRSGMYKCTNGSNPYDYGHNYEKEVAIAGGTLDAEYVKRKIRNKYVCRKDPGCKPSTSRWSSFSKKVEKKPEKKKFLANVWSNVAEKAEKKWERATSNRRLTQLAAGIGVGMIAGLVAVAACAGTAGLGCVVIAGAMTGALIGTPTFLGIDKAYGHKTTGPQAVNYLAKNSVGGGFQGAFRSLMGAGPLGYAIGRVRDAFTR
ncbi:hypothetical protein ACIQZO_40480, partial [Streptomyces sp. NPDC097617]|uniref:hypothetical protein n=1 Tax=Streptomyces sp. NPDC097617 TaxID=3366091 RepID=UPI00380A95F8